MTTRAPLAVLAVSLSAALGCAPPAPAASAPRAATIALQPELKTLSFYVGRWGCEGVALDEQGKVTEKDELEVVVRPELDGSWLSILVFMGGAQVTSELKGFDRAGKRYRHLWATTNGESGSLTSNGWEQDHLSFVEEHSAKAKPERMTFTKIDETHYSHVEESDEGRGYHPVYRKTCSKKAS